jgi:hypothetical protein
MNKPARFLPTAIGSLPHSFAEEAVSLVLRTLTDAPFWPQLPKRGFREQMEIQYSEGLPCIVIDEKKGRIHLDASNEETTAEAIGAFYERYMAAEASGDWSAFAITPAYSAGIESLSKALSGGPIRPWIKVQTTGPITLGLSLVDHEKRAIYYNEMYRDVLVKNAIAKSRWQIATFQPSAKGVICFIDEPILSGFGSSTYVSVARDDVVAILSEVAQAVNAAGALCGVHCCGNTEWPILIDAGIDIINFDAFGFFDSIALYPDAIGRHLSAGKYLAWGLVPTSEKVLNETVDSLTARFNAAAGRLQSAGIDRQALLNQSILTPSCGTGSLSIDQAVKVFDLLAGLSAALTNLI